MRAIKPILLSVLTVTAAACFLAAVRSASDLQERTSATARIYQWQAPLPPMRVAEQIIDLEPATLEEEQATAADVAALAAALSAPQAPDAPAPVPVVKKPRPLVAAPPSTPTVARNEVEPEDAIRMGLRSKRASFEHCYETELKKQAAFSGFILVALSLSASGKVTEARVQEGNRRDAVVGACIVAALRTMKLPALTSEAELLIPIRLQAREPT